MRTLSAVCLLCLFASSCGMFNSWRPSRLFDGPFSGTPVEKCPEITSFELGELPDDSGYIGVSNSTDASRPPIVAIYDASREQTTCTAMTAMENTVVFNLKLSKSVRPIPERDFYFVRGIVQWTYGREGALVHIHKDNGTLKYWYAW